MRPEKTRLAMTRITAGINRIVTLVRSGLPWFDMHLPLIPVPIRTERPAVAHQRSVASGATRGEA